jgi:hypothetical protein
VTTRVFDILRGSSGAGDSGTPLLCIGHTDRSAILRLNDSAVALGLTANGLADAVRTSMADFVEGGGGHAKAGAVRVRAGFVKDAVNELVRAASAAAQKA